MRELIGPPKLLAGPPSDVTCPDRGCGLDADLWMLLGFMPAGKTLAARCRVHPLAGYQPRLTSMV